VQGTPKKLHKSSVPMGKTNKCEMSKTRQVGTDIAAAVRPVAQSLRRSQYTRPNNGAGLVRSSACLA